jgi:hypothetical protein
MRLPGRWRLPLNQLPHDVALYAEVLFQRLPSPGVHLRPCLNFISLCWLLTWLQIDPTGAIDQSHAAYRFSACLDRRFEMIGRQLPDDLIVEDTPVHGTAPGAMGILTTPSRNCLAVARE